MPTDEPSEAPTPKPTTFIPTPVPTPYPTDDSSEESNPILNPTPNPTPVPTSPPIQDSCPYEIRKGLEFDFIVLYDNTCGLSQQDCNTFLEGVTEIVGSVLDYPYLRVQTMQFEENCDPKTIVDFNDDELQNDKTKYAQKVRQDGECTDGGNGKTDLKAALLRAGRQFDLTDDRIDRLIIVSACMDEEPREICQDIAARYDEAGIEVWAVNLIKASNADNVLSNKAWAQNYLSCIVKDDDEICVGDDQNGVNTDEFDRIINKCLSPYICLPPVPDPTKWPS